MYTVYYFNSPNHFFAHTGRYGFVPSCVYRNGKPFVPLRRFFRTSFARPVKTSGNGLHFGTEYDSDFAWRPAFERLPYREVRKIRLVSGRYPEI